MKTIEKTDLQTERLALRSPRRGDVPALIRHCSDPRVALKTSHIPHPYLHRDATGWLERVGRAQEQGSAATFVIERRQDPELIGVISLMIRPDRCSAVVGYWLGVPYWRRGYMTEALREVLRHGFEDLGLLYVNAGHLKGNAASGRVMQKAGMKFENIVAGGCSRDGERFDAVNYGLFADEWRALRE